MDSSRSSHRCFRVLPASSSSVLTTDSSYRAAKPIPAIPPCVVRTPHLHGAPTTEPPAWGRACFNSPECGGGSSPVKTEPPQIFFCCLGHDLMCVYGHSTPVTATVTETNWWQVTWESRLPATSPPPEPSTKNSSSSRAPKTQLAEPADSWEICKIQGARWRNVRISMRKSSSATEASTVHTSPDNEWRAGCRIDTRN